MKHNCGDESDVLDVAINATNAFVLSGFPNTVKVFELSDTISNPSIINLSNYIDHGAIQANDDFLLVKSRTEIKLYDLTDLTESPITQYPTSYIQDAAIFNNYVVISDMQQDFGLYTATVTLYEIQHSSFRELSAYQTNNPDRGTEPQYSYLGHTDQYGYSVELNSNWLFIGCASDDDTGRDAGSVYVYEY